MKNILSIILAASIVLSCSESSTDNTKPEKTKTENNDPLSGSFSSRDAKAEILLKNMSLFANADFSYVSEILAEDFTLSTAGDTAAVAYGQEEAIAYWNNIHGIYEDIRFSEGRLLTFELNNGEVWSAYFGELYAVGKFSKENYAIPLHVWIQWENDKIIRQIDMLDSKFITAEIAAGEAS
tara:strand:+ start:175 stop:717 length:543 start_codon:yes stop_codon:yes gene_type:complete